MTRETETTANSTRSNGSTGSLTKRESLPDLPAIPSPASKEWLAEPTDDLLADCVFMLAVEVQPSLAEKPLRFASMKRRLRKRDYSCGELLYAADRLADDPELDNKIRYGGTLSGADFRRVIEPVRTIRRKLLEPMQKKVRPGRDGEKAYAELTEEEVREAVELVPHLSLDDFNDRSARGDDTERWMLSADARQRLESNTPTS